MDVEFRFFGTVRDVIGERTATREVPSGTTVREVLSALEDDYPGLEGRLLDGDEIAGSITVMRNGTHVTHHDDAATVLADGDRVAITPPVTGG